MALDGSDTTALAQSLLAAYVNRVPIAPFTDHRPDLTVDDAYAILQEQLQHWLAEGRRVAGYKIGLTSAAMQQQMGVSSPDFGYIRDDMLLSTDGEVDLSPYLNPRIEPEFAFRLRSDLRGPGVTRQDVLDAIDSAIVSFELIDSRFEDWRIQLADTVADNASSGGVLLGSVEFDPRAVDLLATRVQVRINGDLVNEGTGDAVLGDPLLAVAWVANTFGVRGQELKAGSLILSGSITSSMSVRPGDVAEANFAGIESLTVTFA